MKTKAPWVASGQAVGWAGELTVLRQTNSYKTPFSWAISRRCIEVFSACGDQNSNQYCLLEVRSVQSACASMHNEMHSKASYGHTVHRSWRCCVYALETHIAIKNVDQSHGCCEADAGCSHLLTKLLQLKGEQESGSDDPCCRRPEICLGRPLQCLSQIHGSWGGSLLHLFFLRGKPWVHTLGKKSDCNSRSRTHVNWAHFPHFFSNES